MTFALEPVDPPEGHAVTRRFRGLEGAMKAEGVDRLPLVGLATAMLRLAGPGAHESTKRKTGAKNECDGETITSTEIDVDRL